MDESERPTDETKGLSNEDAWAMPEPVFRSSSGFTPGVKELDITAEPIVGIKDQVDEDSRGSQSVRVKEEVPSHRHKKKKGGCAKFFTLLAVLVGLIIGVLVAALIYLLFYWRPTSTVF